jgi:hypothetical protein
MRVLPNQFNEAAVVDAGQSQVLHHDSETVCLHICIKATHLNPGWSAHQWQCPGQKNQRSIHQDNCVACLAGSLAICQGGITVTHEQVQATALSGIRKLALLSHGNHKTRIRSHACQCMRISCLVKGVTARIGAR